MSHPRPNPADHLHEPVQALEGLRALLLPVASEDEDLHAVPRATLHNLLGVIIGNLRTRIREISR